MAWLQDVTSGIWRPVRGVGRLLRGKFDEGMADIGHGARTVAPVIMGATGVGLPAAMGVAAAGGAVERGAESNWSGDEMLEGAAGGAVSGAGGYGAGKFGRAAVGKLLGGQPAASAAAAGTPTPKAPTTMAPTPSASPPASPPPRIPDPTVRLAGDMAAQPTIPSRVAMRTPAPTGVGKFLSDAGDVAGDVFDWTGENLGNIGQAAGGFATLYGAAQDDAERRWMRRMMEQDRARNRAMSPAYARLIRELMPRDTARA
jgi:hypothetical protein